MTSESSPVQEPWTDPSARRTFRRAMIVFNPHSGRGWLKTAAFLSPREILKRIYQHLDGYGIPCAAAVPRSAGETTLVVRQSVRAGYDLVIAAGGDGTLNAVVNGLAGTEAVLGVIPLGTVNLLGLELQLPRNLKEACRVIAEGHVTRIDLGKVNQRAFVSVAGIGADADIIRATRVHWKRLFGTIAYGVVGFFRLLRYPFRRITVHIDGGARTVQGYSVIVGNGKYYGGEMALGQDIDLRDGLLDVFVLHSKSFGAFFISLWALPDGRWRTLTDVEHFRCRRLTVSGWRHPVQLDGDYIGHTPVTIHVEPGSLRVLAPRPPSPSGSAAADPR